MGLGGISIWQLVIILAIVLLIFGTKRLKGLGGDLGGAIKGFKEAVSSNEEDAEDAEIEQKTDQGAQTGQFKEKDAEHASNDKTA
ncbi:MAG: twin-arginine translocase subunit TatA [Gammaproteobacteria bacterium]|nr:MAG: twin-arginine translocase subunit TatA [Gammaproteobacteria bacterium]RLA51701.1 MAG: twin-arginine translocase subunit TatA [Gammaproteobacteria bacterium]